MTNIDIEIGKQHVVIFSQHIFRPHDITVTQWLKFWKAVKDIDIEKGFNVKDEEIKVRDAVIVDLQNELQAKADY
jgi:hypothetical protein